MSSGFVSGGVSNPEDDHKTNSAPSERDPWSKAEEAIKTARWQQEERDSKLRSGEEKSLYEILQANKARKQEEFEEKLKFKHQFKPLDEDDVEYLDSILSEQARTEQLRKQELESQLDQFRRAQYEAENAGNTEVLESIPTVEEIVPGGWSAGTRKRKKPTVNESSSSGLKIRKMSATTGVKSKDSTAQQAQQMNNAEPEMSEEETKNGKKEVTLDSKSANVNIPPQKEPVTKITSGDPPTSSKPKAGGAGGLLGLVSYSSDDEED